MLRRVAFLLILLIISGSALLAARHFGVHLPWDVAVVAPEPASKERERPPADATRQAVDPTPERTVEETAAALSGTPDEAPPPAEGGVSIDISRISPDGTSVFAGRAEPDSYVTVLEDGRPTGTTKADAYGEWSLSTEHRFASADPKLSYEVSRTPPPEPEPGAKAEPEPPKPQVAAKAPEPAPPSAASAASEVMRKFESLVEEAREEAKRNEEEARRTEEARRSADTQSEAEKEAASPESPPVADTKEPEPEQRETVTAAAPAPVAGEPTESVGATPAPGTDDSGQSQPPAAAQPEARAETDVAVAPSAAQESASATMSVIPVPITFVYNEATLTPDGRRAARLLLEYLTLKKLSAVELTGHADERGSDAYNFELSRERLDAVSQILREGGYSGELKLIPKGKTEPYMGVDRSLYKGEALHQLDRRVELRLGG